MKGRKKRWVGKFVGEKLKVLSSDDVNFHCEGESKVISRREGDYF